MDKETARQERRKRVYAWVGKQGFAQKAYRKKMAEEKKKVSETFSLCLEEISKEAYSSIYHIPILAWWLLSETGDPTNILKQKRGVTKMEADCLNFMYAMLRDEFRKVFGWGDSKEREIELIQEIIMRNLILQSEDDISQLTFIELAELELKEIVNSNNNAKNDLISLAISLEQALKVKIDINTCSVAMFYGYIKQAEKNG